MNKIKYRLVYSACLNPSFFVLLHLLFSCISAPELSAQQLINISAKDGLPHNVVHSIKQDKNGFIWISTEDGLCKYNGYEFTVYRANQNKKHNIPDNLAKCFCLDNENNIWIGTEKGLCRYNAVYDGFEQFFDEQRIKEGNDIVVNTICEAGNGKLWLGTKQGTIYLLDKKTKKFEVVNIEGFKPSANSSINKLYQDSQKRLWICTHQLGLLLYNPKDKSLQVFNTGTSVLTHNFVVDIQEDAIGNLWIAGYIGIYILKKYANKIENFSSNKELPEEIKSGIIYSLLVDKKGNIWIGTQQNGIYK